ncbi:MAG TPA: ornithine cyclodeaminase family protein [Parvularculaceae bacterium]|nr:ornithine cyclodeaminase family protein [Caulobacterales bacterium]HPE32161.1 ornithine cyclodeaminase family protein [Parvularculaceae bacterium]
MAALHFVSDEVAQEVFDWRSAVARLQDVYAHEFGAGASPPRTVAVDGPSWLRTLPGNPPGLRHFGAKIMGATMTAPTPTADYVIVLFEKASGRIAGFLDAKTITGFRTAATTAAAIDKLIPAGPVRLGVIGSGLEASMHTRAFASIRDLTEITVFSPSPGSRERFAATMAEELGVGARAVASPEIAVGGVDLVLTAARSRDETPILFSDWIAPHSAVVSIGSTIPSQREIDISVIERADLIVCDMLEETLNETGDMIAAKKAGIAFEEKCISLNSLLNGSAAKLVSDARRPMYKSVGAGIQDVVVGALIFEKAVAAGLATPLAAEFSGKAL